jgi:putative ABC transport system ATP-binding protein
MKEQMKTTFVFSTHDQKIVGEAEVIYSLEDGELVGKKTQGGKNNG